MYLKWLKSVLAKILCKPLSMCGNHSYFLLDSHMTCAMEIIIQFGYVYLLNLVCFTVHIEWF